MMATTTAPTLWDFGGHARRTDPETSHGAARSLRGITDAHTAILETFREWGPLTDEQVWERIHIRISPSGARTRRKELVDMGILRDTGKRDRTLANRLTIVWGLS